MSRIAGIAKVTVDGISYMLAGDLKYTPTSVKRETLVGQDAVHGYSELPIQGSIECSVRDANGLNIGDLNNQTNVTVVAELANGKTVIGQNMWTVDQQQVDTMEAKVTVKWEGLSVTEIV